MGVKILHMATKKQTDKNTLIKTQTQKKKFVNDVSKTATFKPASPPNAGSKNPLGSMQVSPASV